MRKKYPNAKITIAADNDQFNEDGYNPGLTKAKEAAVAIKARVVIPEFLDKSEKPTNFNDLLILEGAELENRLRFAPQLICQRSFLKFV